MSTPPLRINGVQFGPYNNTVNVMALGAVGDHSTDNSTALQNAINQAKTANAVGSKGGVISLPPGIFNFSTPLDLHDTTGIVFRGDASYAIGAAAGPPSTILNYTGTGASSAINAKSAFGTRFENLGITYSSGSFTGNLLDFSHAASANDAAFNVITDCYIGAYNQGNLSSAAALVYLNDAVSSTIQNTHFMGAAVGIKFRNLFSDYSNAHSVINCTFQDFATAATMNAGQNVSIQHCSFEHNPIIGTPTMAPAYADNTTTGSSGAVALDFSYNWVGDGDDSAYCFDTGAAISFLEGLTMRGNFIQGKIRLNNVISGVIDGNALNGNGSTSPAIVFAGTQKGLTISNNSIINTLTMSVPSTGVSVWGNKSWNAPYDITDAPLFDAIKITGTTTLGGTETWGASTLGAIQSKGMTVTGLDAANGVVPFTLDTTNAYTGGGTHIVDIKTGGATKGFVDAVGTANFGAFDASTAAQLNIGTSTATGLTIGKAGIRSTFPGTVRVQQGFAGNYRTAASTVTAAVTDVFIGVTGTGARTVNLPAASTCIPGAIFIVQDVGNDVGTITINRAGADTINGATTKTISAAFGRQILVCDGVSSWWADTTTL